MTGTRIIFLIVSLSLIGGAYYMSYNGIWGESRDLDRSVRLGDQVVFQPVVQNR